ncbi:MAG: hypothetical protein K2X39_04570, partial [Silvanigrellaceae bacterium]|nr:hypothetical protein [Silvanigrellaceae bacterium]
MYELEEKDFMKAYSTASRDLFRTFVFAELPVVKKITLQNSLPVSIAAKYIHILTNSNVKEGEKRFCQAVLIGLIERSAGKFYNEYKTK